MGCTCCSCVCRHRMTSVWEMMPLILSSLEGDSVTYMATWWMLLAGDLGGRMMLPGLEKRKHCLQRWGVVFVRCLVCCW